MGIQIMGMEIAVDPSLLFHQAFSNYGNYELRDERRSVYCDVRIEEVYRFEGRIRRSNRDRVRTRSNRDLSLRRLSARCDIILLGPLTLKVKEVGRAV